MSRLACEIFPMVKETLLHKGIAEVTMLGYSMVPYLLNRRDKIILENASGKQLRVGDVVLIETSKEVPEYLLHRIVKITEAGYIARGDGNEQEDEVVTEGQILGKAVSIVRKGRQYSCDGLTSRIYAFAWNRMGEKLKGLLLDRYRIRVLMTQAETAEEDYRYGVNHG